MGRRVTSLTAGAKPSVLRECASASEDIVASDPGCELRFNRTDDVLEIFEVAIVQATTADELAHSLEGIEFGLCLGRRELSLALVALLAVTPNLRGTIELWRVRGDGIAVSLGEQLQRSVDRSVFCFLFFFAATHATARDS